ncbi:hypothetical protein [Litorimonas sp. WD9-15]|uniref:hypothetical protein n=1 Tax=Litorimonas sp. WD9-15 TaxID=3418716 RepID=UPI003CFD9992
MTKNLTEEERRVLRILRGDIGVNGPRGGKAFDATRIELRRKNFLTFGEMRLTPKATEALATEGVDT